MTIPGVGLGFHSDPTKSTQYSPQIAGGNGRNVNYQIDGGDNNDDTVGGLLQLFPLEAIQEFNFITQRYKAEYGRSNGGVMNIVTKSGTNELQGQLVHVGPRQEHEREDRDREAEQRRASSRIGAISTGGSFGGPIVQNKAHFFAAFERTQQDTQQAVTTLGLYPEPGRRVPDAEPGEPVHGQGFGEPDAAPSTCRCVTAAIPTRRCTTRRTARRSGKLGRQHEHVQLDQPESQLGACGREAERVHLPVRGFRATTSRLGPATPQQTYPNGVTIGYNTNTPQTTEQHKFQFRDDFSWHATGKGGLGHDFKAGVNFINEPHLFVTFSSGSTDYAYTHLTNDMNGPISRVTRNKPGASANLPMKQYGAYIQDDWRLTDRLTVNAGLRYDLVTGFLIDQSRIPNYVALTAAAAAGRFNGVPGFEEFGKKAQEDKNNIQPRIGAVYDLLRRRQGCRARADGAFTTTTGTPTRTSCSRD